MNWFLRIWWISLFLKAILAGLLPLAADEAYYWFWSHRLQWSYFDHPPGVALLMWLGRPFEDWASFVRIPGVVLGHATLLIWWRLLRDRLDETELKAWTALSLLTPFIGFGSIVITPDLPVLFFWALSLLCFERVLARKTAIWYAALGLSLGLGFSSKYHIVLLVPVFLLHLTLDRRWRSVKPTLVPVTVLTGLIGSFPVLYWNAVNDWQSFRFQLNHGLGRETWNPEWTLTYIAGQVLLFGPPLIPALIRGVRRPGWSLFAWNALFVWGFFLYSSFRAVVEANWPIVAFPAAIALTAAGLKSLKPVVWTCAFWTLAAILAGSHWVSPWFPFRPANLEETRQYRSLAALTEKYSPLFANTYQMASILSFESKKQILKLNDMSRYDFYDRIPESTPSSGSFFLIKRQGQNLPKWLEDSQYEIETMETPQPDFEVLRITLK